MPPKQKQAVEPERTIDLDQFPPLMPGVLRDLYFFKLSPLDTEALKLRGYNPVNLRTLPNVTPTQHEDYLRAYAQATLDGTIVSDKEQIATLKLVYKSAGLLSDRKVNLNVNIDANNKVLGDILAWGSSRHTLRAGNTTIVDAKDSTLADGAKTMQKALDTSRTAAVGRNKRNRAEAIAKIKKGRRKRDG